MHEKKGFTRERRYVVLKGTDLNVLTEQEQKRLFTIAEMVANGRNAMGKPPLDCFVLEHDWPEFDIVVDMVRRRMEGEPTRESELLDKLREARQAFSIRNGQHADYVEKADAVIRNLKEKLLTANDIAETVFKLATNAPELNRSDIDHDAACQLDAAMIEIHGILKSYLVGGACSTCGGSGSVGGCSGQTPESYQEETYPCPDCTESTVITSSGRQPGMQTIRDLAMLVKQLCRALAKVDNPNGANKGLYLRALDYLKRKGLQGSPLRVVAHGDHADSSWQERCQEFDAHLKTEGLRDGEPCGHPGCASHISHPCEGCGRIGARAQDSAPWVTEWDARVPRFALVAKADGAYTREAADGEYVKWADHVAKLQELLKYHGGAALQEIDRLLEVNASLLHTVYQACSYLWGYSNDADMGTHVKRLLQNCLLARGTDQMKASIKRAITERTPAIIDGEVTEPPCDPLRFCDEQGHPNTAAILDHFQRGAHENATLGAVLACKKANGWDDVEMLAWLANHLLISNNDLQKKLLAEINRRALPAVFPPLSVMVKPVTAWSKELPDKGGPDTYSGWWYWNGDPDEQPQFVDVVMRSCAGGEKRPYVMQFSDWAANMEGAWWHLMVEPEVPRG